jgi:hypothetical protein
LGQLVKFRISIIKLVIALWRAVKCFTTTAREARKAKDTHVKKFLLTAALIAMALDAMSTSVYADARTEALIGQSTAAAQSRAFEYRAKMTPSCISADQYRRAMNEFIDIDVRTGRSPDHDPGAQKYATLAANAQEQCAKDLGLPGPDKAKSEFEDRKAAKERDEGLRKVEEIRKSWNRSPEPIPGAASEPEPRPLSK